MAQVGYIQTDENNIIVGWHSDTPSNLPSGHNITQELTIEDPSGLLGLPDTEISKTPKERDIVGEVSVKKMLRFKLLQLSNVLDLMVKMGEDTTTVQADFDDKKAAYQALP